MSPPADFLIVGGDIAQLGDPVELELGAEILREVTIKKLYIPGEHDWYLDMGVAWRSSTPFAVGPGSPRGALHRARHRESGP